jgi:5-methylcytosine-specific restriction endonuclease McrA
MEAQPVAQTSRKPLPARLREEVLWSGPCAYCGYDAPTQVDHVMPLSRGGTDDRANLVPACRPCNMNKLDFTPEEWRAYRLAEGLPWPPPTPRDVIADIYRKLKSQYGETSCTHIPVP